MIPRVSWNVASALGTLNILFLLVGCNGFEKQLVTSVCGGGSAKADASPVYKSEVQPVLFANCQTCHRNGGQAPSQFADSSRPLDQLYRDARQRLSLSGVEASLLFIRGTDGHCNGCDVAGNPNVMREALQPWLEAEEASIGQCVSGGNNPNDPSNPNNPVNKNFVYTAKVNIPATLSLTNFQSLSFPLADLGVSGTATMEIRRYTDRSTLGPGSYEVRNIRIQSPNALYAYRGTVKVDGTDGSFSTVDYEHINTGVPAFGTPGVDVSTRSSILIQQGATGDQVSIGFSKLEGAQSGCRELSLYNPVETIIQARCISCHGGANAQATGRMSLLQASGAISHCNNLRARSTFPPQNSLIITRPQNDLGGVPAGRQRHPDISATFSVAERNTIQAWIAKELPH